MMADSDKVGGSLNDITRKNAHGVSHFKYDSLSLHSLSKFV